MVSTIKKDMEANVWIINIVTNTCLGAILIAIIKFFMDRFIKQIDEKFLSQDRRISEIEKYADDTRTYFTEEIKDVVEDKTNYRISNAGILAKMEAQLNNVYEFVKEIRKKLFDHN